MAAATVATGFPKRSIVGDKVRLSFKLTAPADGDTLNVATYGLYMVDDFVITYNTATVAAADAISASLSGTTLTFKVIGTARDLNVIVTGN